MRIVEIKALDNGAHNNQTIDGIFAEIPDGYAVIPDGMKCENFPFGEVNVEVIEGVPVVVEWIPGVIPEPEPMPEPEPTAEELLNIFMGVANDG